MSNVREYKKVVVAITGNSSVGKSSIKKAAQAIYFMKRLAIPEAEQTEFYKDKNLVNEMKDKGYGLRDLFDDFCYKVGDTINYQKLLDFVNIPFVKQTLEDYKFLENDPTFKTYFTKDDFGDLALRQKLDAESVAVSLGEPKHMYGLYESVVAGCEAALKSRLDLEGEGISLRDIVMNTSSTVTYTVDESLTKRKVNLEETVWVDVDGEWVQIILKDLGGQTDYRFARPKFYKDIDAAIVVFDASNQASLSDIGKFPEHMRTIPFPPYDQLDGVNMGLLLRVLEKRNPQHFEEFTSNVPKKYKKDSEEFYKNLAKADTKDQKSQEAIRTVIKNWFPENFYNKFLGDHPDYQVSFAQGWLQELYNTRNLQKTNANEIVMVPVTLFGNKYDLAADNNVYEEGIVAQINNMSGDVGTLPFLLGSANTLDNVYQLFKITGLMGLRVSEQITKPQYNKHMKEITDRVSGAHSLTGWFQQGDAEPNVLTIE
jgi:GTPase SAR1 family protein